MEDRFVSACDHLPSLVKKLDKAVLLKFYAFYKQATIGECNIDKPSWYSMEAKSKYYAWHELGKMKKTEAMTKYIELLNEIDPGWEQQEQVEIDWDDSTKGVDSVNTKGWVNVSSMIKSETDLKDGEKSVYEWVKEGNLSKLEKLRENFNPNTLDENGLNCLHWACDRGHFHIVKYLVEECAADVHSQDADGDTSIDYAKAIENQQIIDYLLKKGA